jgi:hypothetical protein
VFFSRAAYWIFIMPIFYVACKTDKRGLGKMNFCEEQCGKDAGGVYD